MTSLVVVNNGSRQGDCDIGEVIDALHDLGPVIQCAPDSAAEFERSLRDSREPVSRIVLGGGDGTINRLLPTLIEAAVPCGIIPLGTANDFARSLGLSLNPSDAAGPIIAGSTRRVRMGEVNGKPFLNAVGIGAGPALTRKLDGERKKRLGVLAYLSSLLEVRAEIPRQRATMTLDGERRDVVFIQITIAKGIHYGGGMTISEDAALDDDCLRVLCIEPQSPAGLIGKLVALRTGTSAKDAPEDILLFEVSEVSVEPPRPMDVTADGELITKTPISCKVHSAMLEFYAPEARD
jgi:YegS/Rv2252/BmrU family lipid kinase